MKKETPADLITTKVTKKALKNFKVAAALSGKKVYEVSEEGSEYVHGKYLSKTKK